MKLWPSKYYRGLTRKKALERKKEINKFKKMDWKNANYSHNFYDWNIFRCVSLLLSVYLYLCFSFCLFVSLFVGLSVSLSDFLYYFISVYHFYVSLPFSATAFLFLSASVCDSVSICLMCGMVLSEQL